MFMLNANRRFKAAALGKITFGNILMTLLCLGTFAVAGLMYMMYQQVISTPETTAASYQRDQNAAASNPELMLPNGKTAQQGASAPAAQMPPARVVQAASEAQTAIDETPQPVETAPRRHTPRKPAATAEKPVEPTDTQAVELKPTNLSPQPRQERVIAPTNQAAERPLKPESTPPRRERQRPARESNDATDYLF